MDNRCSRNAYPHPDTREDTTVTTYQIKDTEIGLVPEGTFDSRFDAIVCARALDADGYDCQVLALDAQGRVTGCVYGEHTWGSWDEEA